MSFCCMEFGDEKSDKVSKHTNCRVGPRALLVIEAHVVRLSEALRDSWGGTKPIPCQGATGRGAKGSGGHGSSAVQPRRIQTVWNASCDGVGLPLLQMMHLNLACFKGMLPSVVAAHRISAMCRASSSGLVALAGRASSPSGIHKEVRPKGAVDVPLLAVQQ